MPRLRQVSPDLDGVRNQFVPRKRMQAYCQCRLHPNGSSYDQSWNGFPPPGRSMLIAQYFAEDLLAIHSL